MLIDISSKTSAKLLYTWHIPAVIFLCVFLFVIVFIIIKKLGGAHQTLERMLDNRTLGLILVFIFKTCFLHSELNLQKSLHIYEVGLKAYEMIKNCKKIVYWLL